MLNFTRALELLKKSNDILIVSHNRPDGDACGSMAALEIALAATGKKVSCLLLSPLPQWYSFIFPTSPEVLGETVTSQQLNDGSFFDGDLVILVDVNCRNQLEGFVDYLEQKKQPVLVIDHHVTSDALGDIEIVDTKAAAAGIVVYDLLTRDGFPIDRNVAEALFLAISTDTGWFRFGNTDNRTLAVVARLTECGANPAKLYHEIYENFSVEKFSLMVKMLQSIQIHFDGRYVEQQITQKDFQQTNATASDSENLIDECRRIKTLQAAALFVELADGKVKCSLRSTGSIDVRLIAQKFGGGGHKAAAGVHLPGPLEKAKKMICDEIAKVLR